jgi:hypothetical protein
MVKEGTHGVKFITCQYGLEDLLLMRYKIITLKKENNMKNLLVKVKPQL